MPHLLPQHRCSTLLVKSSQTGLESSDKYGSSEFVYLPNLVLTFHKCEIQGGNLMLPKMLLLSLKLLPNKKKSLSNFKEFSRHTYLH